MQILRIGFALALMTSAGLVLLAPPAAAGELRPSLEFRQVPPVSVWDRDGDGFDEVSFGRTAGGACGGNYPVFGAGAAASAAGQSADVRVATIMALCGTGVSGHVDPNEPDANAAPSVDPSLTLRVPGLGNAARVHDGLFLFL